MNAMSCRKTGGWQVLGNSKFENVKGDDEEEGQWLCDVFRPQILRHNQHQPNKSPRTAVQ